MILNGWYYYPVGGLVPLLQKPLLQNLPEAPGGPEPLHYRLGLGELLLLHQVLHTFQIGVQSLLQRRHRDLGQDLGL